MDVEEARDTLAAAARAYPDVDLAGYREPPGELVLPAFVVRDPIELNYHPTYDAGADTLVLHGRVLVPLTISDASARPLDRLITYTALPHHLERYSTDVWEQLTVVRMVPRSITTYATGDGDPVAISADLEIRVTW